MASYAQRPDGLYDVTLDDGRTVPTALDPGALEAQGIYANAPALPPVPDERTAFNAAALGTPAQVPGAGDLGASPAFNQLMGSGAPRLDAPASPVGPPMSPPAPEQNMSVMPPAGVTPIGPPAQKRDLVPIAPIAATPSTAGLSDTDLATQAFLKGEFAPKGGVGRKIPAHDERKGFSIRYRDVPEDPQLEEDISESRIDQQLARQGAVEQGEYAKSVEAKLAAQNAQEAQQQVEQTLVRKNQIEKDVGAQIQAIEDRFAKARAVTAQGSARERVWKDKGWFGRILATIGIALGEFGRPSAGGRNPVEDRINEEVKEEFEREKELYNVEPETSALKAYVDAWGSPQGAQKEYELQLKNAAITKLEAWARRADAAQIPIEFQNWLADQALQVQEAKKKLQEDMAAEVVEQHQLVPDKYLGGAARPDPLKVMKRTAEFREAYEKATGQSTKDMKPSDLESIYGRSVSLPNGGMAFAPDAKRAQESQELLAAVEMIRSNMRDIREIMKKPASEVNLADRERLKAAVRSNTSVARTLEKTGVPNPADMVILDPLTGAAALERLNPMKPDVAIIAGLEAGEKHFARRARAIERSLYRDPQLKQPLQSGSVPSFKERP